MKAKGDVSERIGEIFKDSYNKINGTHFGHVIPEETYTDADLILTDSEGKIMERVQHVTADPDWLQRATAVAFDEIGGTLQESIDQSGIRKDFLLSVNTSNSYLPNLKVGRIELTRKLSHFLSLSVERLRTQGVKDHEFDWEELATSCGDDVADAFTLVRITFARKVYENNVLRPGVTYWVPESWIEELVSNSVDKKEGKYYSKPEEIILLVELSQVPHSQEDIELTTKMLHYKPPSFKEVWIASEFMDRAAKVWPTQEERNADP